MTPRTDELRTLTVAVAAAVSLAAVVARAQTPPMLLAGMTSAKAEDAPGPGDPAVVIYRAPQCGAPGVPNESSPARFVRVATWLDEGRPFFESNPPRAAGVCTPFKLQSNVVVSADEAFWVDNQSQQLPGTSALKRLSRNANPGDVPAELTPVPAPPVLSPLHELVATPGRLYMLYRNYLGSDALVYVDTPELSGGSLIALASAPAGTMTDLQWDGAYVWWREGANLRRYSPGTGAVQTIDTGVGGYHSTGCFCM